jgi:hypothetical protein
LKFVGFAEVGVKTGSTIFWSVGDRNKMITLLNVKQKDISLNSHFQPGYAFPLDTQAICWGVKFFKINSEKYHFEICFLIKYL